MPKAATVTTGGIAARATGDASVLAALRRMVPAHAAQLATDQRWRVAARDRGDSVELVVTSDDPVTTRRIRALGFFGLMASQDHHRAHHLAIARGMVPNGH